MWCGRVGSAVRNVRTCGVLLKFDLGVGKSVDLTKQLLQLSQLHVPLGWVTQEKRKTVKIIYFHDARPAICSLGCSLLMYMICPFWVCLSLLLQLAMFFYYYFNLPTTSMDDFLEVFIAPVVSSCWGVAKLHFLAHQLLPVFPDHLVWLCYLIMLLERTEIKDEVSTS